MTARLQNIMARPTHLDRPPTIHYFSVTWFLNVAESIFWKQEGQDGLPEFLKGPKPIFSSPEHNLLKGSF